MNRNGLPLLHPSGLWAPPDTAPLRGLPQNLGHESDPFGVQLLELARRNAEALHLGATGEDLDADETVTAGHKHDEPATAIRWCQLAAWDLCADNDSSGREGLKVTTTTLTTYLVGLLEQVVSLPLYLRARVSVPAPGTSTETALHLRFKLDSLTTRSTEFEPPSYVVIQSNATKTYDNEWVLVGPLTGDEIALVVQACVDSGGGAATLHEIQVGYP